MNVNCKFETLHLGLTQQRKISISPSTWLKQDKEWKRKNTNLTHKEKTRSGDFVLSSPVYLYNNSHIRYRKKQLVFLKCHGWVVKQRLDIVASLLTICQIHELDLIDDHRYSLYSVLRAVAAFWSMVETTWAVLVNQMKRTVIGEVLYENIIMKRGLLLMVCFRFNNRASFQRYLVTDSILNQLLALTKQFNTHRIDFLVDRYKSIFIKQLERQKKDKTWSILDPHQEYQHQQIGWAT